MRSSRPLSKHEYIQKVLENPRNKSVFHKLESQTQDRVLKYAQRVFDKPRDDGSSEQDKIVDLLFSAIIQISTDEELQAILLSKDFDKDQILDQIIKVFHLNEISHALRLRDSVKGKLEAIKLLEQHIENGEVESAFVQVLSGNPWLMNPTWEVKKSIQTQTWLSLIKSNNEKPDRIRTDIIIEVLDESLPIIIELKREKYTGYSAPDAEEVVNQIQGYRKAIAQKITVESIDNNSVSASKIKAYFICGSKAMEQIKLVPDDLDYIRKNDITLITYESIIKRAKQMLEVMFKDDINQV